MCVLVQDLFLTAIFFRFTFPCFQNNTVCCYVAGKIDPPMYFLNLYTPLMNEVNTHLVDLLV